MQSQHRRRPTPDAGVVELPSFDRFREAVSTTFVPLEVTGASTNRFQARLHYAPLGGIQLTEITAGSHVVERTPDLIARGDTSYFKLSVQLEGSCLLVQDDREAVLRPGDIAVYDTGRPYSMAFDADFRVLVVMFPYQLLNLSPEAVRQVTAVRFPGRDGLGAVISPFLAQLVGQSDRMPGPASVRMANSALDLVATLISTELDLKPGAGHAHRALLRRIHEYIDDNLGSPDLAPGQIAAAHYISTRHLHGLFHEDGATVSTWIRQRRLERCRRDLLDPLLAHRPVSAIAARWGFLDAAHFSRIFKAAFGENATEARRALTR